MYLEFAIGTQVPLPLQGEEWHELTEAQNIPEYPSAHLQAYPPYQKFKSSLSVTQHT